MGSRQVVEVYEDAAGEFRWRKVVGNGEITATSGEGYSRSYDAIDAAQRENPGSTIRLLNTAQEAEKPE